MTKHKDTINYQLPDGRIVAVSYDLSRAASVITYTLATGQVVEAVIMPGER